MNNTIKLTECPRDAMQGIKKFIPTELKIKYLQALLEVGFDTLDFGSFVSPKTIPQLADTHEVIQKLSPTKTQLLAIIANERGAEEATLYNQINVLGFPFSVSEQFQLRNTNSSRKAALERVKNIQTLCEKSEKKLRIYLSMAFGNPYNEEWNTELVLTWAEKIAVLGIEELVLSDTIGVANQQSISNLFQAFSKELPQIEVSAHFHSKPTEWLEKVESAFANSCTSFDAALKGFGGCPMANDELVGNLATENLLAFFKNKAQLYINETALSKASLIADEIFLNYH